MLLLASIIFASGVLIQPQILARLASMKRLVYQRLLWDVLLMQGMLL